jgi:ATP-dependent Zn protease
MVDQLAVILGGRASELIFFGKATSGAVDDLQKAS